LRREHSTVDVDRRLHLAAFRVRARVMVRVRVRVRVRVEG